MECALICGVNVHSRECFTLLLKSQGGVCSKQQGIKYEMM